MDLCIYPCQKGGGCNTFSAEWLRGVSDRAEYKPDILGYSRMDFHRNYSLFEQIEGFYGTGGDGVVVPVYPLPPNSLLQMYNDEGLQRRDDDSCRKRLTFAWGKDMKKLKPSRNETPWNRGILAFIKELPDDALYILWWH